MATSQIKLMETVARPCRDNFVELHVDSRVNLRSKTVRKHTQSVYNLMKTADRQEKRMEEVDPVVPTTTQEVQKSLNDARFKDGDKMMLRLKEPCQSSDEAGSTRLSGKYHSLLFAPRAAGKDETVADCPDHMKYLEKRVDATKGEYNGDCRTRLFLSMAVAEDSKYRSLISIKSVAQDITTANKARVMLLERKRKRLDQA